MPSTFIEPFDLKTILIQYFLGSQELLVYAFLIIISFACAKLGMSNRLFLGVLAITSLIMASFLGEAIYILILMIIGFSVFKIIGSYLQ